MEVKNNMGRTRPGAPFAPWRRFVPEVTDVAAFAWAQERIRYCGVQNVVYHDHSLAAGVATGSSQNRSHGALVAVGS